MRSRAIYGCLGPELSDSERDFFRDVKPWGFIIFLRNIVDRDQVRRLCNSLRETVNDPKAPILIDQEGGRVMRLKPPVWPPRPAAGVFGELHTRNAEAAVEATYLNARLIAHDLAEIGVNTNCLPVLDVPGAGVESFIGDRAFATDPTLIIELGRAQIEGLMDGGVLPVMKHIPGHGRGVADSHFVLPRVSVPAEELSATDFVTFRSLNNCPMAMTAHVVYEAIDAVRPATTSPKIIRDVIRGEIGFDGLLMSDDVSMNALEGSISARTRASLFAGCDIALHCNGVMAEMLEVASEAKPLEGPSLKRSEQVMGHLSAPAELDVVAAGAHLRELMGAA